MFIAKHSKFEIYSKTFFASVYVVAIHILDFYIFLSFRCCTPSAVIRKCFIFIPLFFPAFFLLCFVPTNRHNENLNFNVEIIFLCGCVCPAFFQFAFDFISFMLSRNLLFLCFEELQNVCLATNKHTRLNIAKDG